MPDILRLDVPAGTLVGAGCPRSARGGVGGAVPAAAGASARKPPDRATVGPWAAEGRGVVARNRTARGHEVTAFYREDTSVLPGVKPSRVDRRGDPSALCGRAGVAGFSEATKADLRPRPAVETIRATLDWAPLETREGGLAPASPDGSSTNRYGAGVGAFPGTPSAASARPPRANVVGAGRRNRPGMRGIFDPGKSPLEEDA
jgi:hypothetical protein